MVPTGTGFRDHYRTRVKKNIDFGELSAGLGSTIRGAGHDGEMDSMLSAAPDDFNLLDDAPGCGRAAPPRRCAADRYGGRESSSRAERIH